MSLDPSIDAKLDRLLEAAIEQRTLLKVVDSRLNKLELQHSADRERIDKRFMAVEEYVDAEKERLDKRFETDVRPLRLRHDGFSFLKSCAVVTGIVLALLHTGLQLQTRFFPAKPASQPAPEVRSHAQVPEVRSPRRRSE